MALNSCCVINRSQNQSTTKTADRMELLTPTIKPGFFADKKDMTYRISNAYLNDTILTIGVEFFGGCKEHEFDLVFNGLYKKSLPRKADLFIVHESNGDTCKSEVKKEVYFNLTPIIGTQKQAVDFTIVGFDSVVKYKGNLK